jgi:hypothetical protein
MPDVGDERPAARRETWADSDIAAQEATVRNLVAKAHEHIRAGNDGQAVEAFNAAAEEALAVLVARVEYDEPPSQMSADDHAAWRLVSDSSTEFQHGNHQLGEWFRESARRRALERYDAPWSATRSLMGRT